ncbi:hypothetical protein TIFTF001_009161 [Ficus carica]|uniref:Uncharacterized protein n=1 Tax=Ficus carica TaxID=3494 RepID=A0AA88AGD9_FICCA|nr:hypothetical protein TIFTF001_009161 [Ficus carica]
MTGKLLALHSVMFFFFLGAFVSIAVLESHEGLDMSQLVWIVALALTTLYVLAEMTATSIHLVCFRSYPSKLQ